VSDNSSVLVEIFARLPPHAKNLLEREFKMELRTSPSFGYILSSINIMDKSGDLVWHPKIE
jgi:hypothetical protein